jgi:MobA-like NTP transferase protein
VINESYQQGMGTSLRTGLAALSSGTNAALIVLADQLFVRAKTLDRLIDQYEQSGAQIAIPIYKGFRGNPVLLGRSVFPEVMALTGDIGCRAIFENHVEGIVKVLVDDIGILLDLDTKDDVEKLREFRQGAADESVLVAAADLEGREISNPENSRQDRELVIVGSEPVGIALAKLAKILGFTVTVVDPFLKPSDWASVSQKNIGPELMARRVVGKVPVGSHGAERVTASDETPVEIVIL